MPWYWSDDVAEFLLAEGKIDADAAVAIAAVPVAFRRDGDTIEDVAVELVDEGELPLAA